jgi:hypothetical protein
MSRALRGRIESGRLVLEEPSPFPDGTEVFVRLTPVEPIPPALSREEFLALPFFGMWADREDLKDSRSWVRAERAAWQQRLNRPG